MKYIIDLFSKKYYGPYGDDEIEEIQFIVKLVKIVADFCVEEGTNVLIVDKQGLDQDFKNFQYSSTYELKKQVEKLNKEKI